MREHRARILSGDLRKFVEAAWHVLEPATQFVGGRHLDVVCEYLMAVTLGQMPRLIINLPPRMTKSTLVSIMWPCWEWTRDDAASRWMFASYSASLSGKHSMDRRTLLTSDWYKQLWPNVQLADDGSRQMEFTSTARGHMIATSVGGRTTGLGGDTLVLDDPHSAEQALSDLERASGVRYVRQTLLTRLDDQRRGKIVVVMQRLHQSDIAGELLADGGWEHLCLPAIAETRQTIFLPISGITITREEGDLLEPQRLSGQALDGLKRSMGSYAFAGQMQQRPAPAEGGILKSLWFRYYKTPPSFDNMLQSWDCAFKALTDSDFVAGAVAGLVGPKIFLVDVVNRRMGYSATKAAIKSNLVRFRSISHTLIEDKANGSAVIEELQRDVTGIVAVEPAGGKVSRAFAASADLEAGNVYLPEGADWVPDLINQIDSFPNGRNDDMVDALTQLINYRRMYLNVLGVIDDLKQQEARLNGLDAARKAAALGPSHCPQCAATTIVKVAGSWRCNSCGHQIAIMPVPDQRAGNRAVVLGSVR
jgi:predicted phage terminase large subunit-like protein